MNKTAVRAGLGTQLFQLLIGLSKYREELKEIHWWNPYLNNKENKRKRPDLGKDFYLENLYDLKNFSIKKNSIQPSLVPPINYENIDLVYNNLSFLKSCLRPKFEVKRNNLQLLHKRGWDTPFLNERFYQDFKLKNKNFEIISDSTINEDGNLKNACEDFILIYNSDLCVGAWSMFTVSAAVLNKNLKLYMIDHKHWNIDIYGGRRRKEVCIQQANMFIDKFSNINWYKE